MPETSIILRTKNEEKWVEECLKRLFEQTYRDFEIVVVDSGSTDRTLEIVDKFDVKLFQIRPEEFSYPFALNYGCSRASATKYFVILSGHSLPSSKTWLADGLSNLTDERVMGVYGFVWPLPDASVWEKIVFNRYLGAARRLIKGKVSGIFKRRIAVRSAVMGILGFTNAIVRRGLWEKHHFDERYGRGGEDWWWAHFWLKKGYYAVLDRNFSVYHSHGLGLFGLRAQFKHWKSLSKPQPFKPLEFRKKR